MVSIRPMTAGDLPATQELLLQLGYPLSSEELRQCYEAVVGAANHTLMLAEQAGRVVAFCHVYARPALDKPPEAIVQALVVDLASRGSGMGKTMMTAVETWARDRGFTSVALTSSMTRAEAHAFYEAIGYQRTATSHMFRKYLAG